MFSSSMRAGSLFFSALILVLVALGPELAGHTQKAWAAGADKADIRFRWAFGAIAGGGENPKLRSIAQDTVLKSGDKFKMMVELKKKCFVYVVYKNSQGELSVLFPYSLQQFTTDYEPSKKYYIPRGDAWFQLDDHPGQETFYLLASDERLSEVEYLFNQYATADADQKPEIAGQLIAEIKKMEKQHPNLLANADDRPHAVQGAVRGVERAQGRDPSDVATISGEISSDGFYTKTFTIEHR